MAIPGLGLVAETVRRFAPANEADTFDMEYWSLEQAKLGKGSEKPLVRQVVLVTGGAGAIGAATARAFAAQGAAVVVLDLDPVADVATAEAIAAGGGAGALGIGCDLTDPSAVRQAFAAACIQFGGLDIVVSNAGAAWTGAIADLPDTDLRASFELNLFAHQTVAQAAVAVFRAQGFGGQLLFNVSKQALPRPRLRRLQERSGARSVSEEVYMAGNLLGREVRASDVADAFVALAKLERSTGAVLTVDGGKVAGMVS
ncbi:MULTISPECIES: SDR family NAD(P)-dependent oxidoreductase [Synechococcales]|uniref:SDR family NAD(P)-dependent oxidoreductase n=1 Tax=unclassified Synechococcus TaxID=2626047 RepID=UPI0021A28F99|nr:MULTISPECIES: SDR family NAD(P)-dependent oxidoreductase [unclassified Synechococcus]